jgi:UDP-3-O-[3-hydroxymyristoyl] glucosamine N-acyltransferase
MRFTELIEKSNISLASTVDFDVGGFSPVTGSIKQAITFAVDKDYLEEAIENATIAGVFVSEKYAKEQVSDKIILSTDPVSDFYHLRSIWWRLNEVKYPSSIAETTIIHKTATIAERNVTIGEDTTIEENVAIKPGVQIGKRCIIHSNCVIGGEGFEVRSIEGKNEVISHDGKVIIGDDVEIQSLCNIDKGLMGRDTLIGDETKIDSLVHVAHGVKIGKRCKIVAQVMISGSCTIGDDVWIGPGATISNGLTIGARSRISIGSTVVSNVKKDDTVTGYFAESHNMFIRKMIQMNKFFKRKA